MSVDRRARRAGATAVLGTVLALLGPLVAACHVSVDPVATPSAGTTPDPAPPGDSASPGDPASPSEPAGRVELTFAAFGRPAVTAPLRTVVADYNVHASATTVTFQAYRDRASLLAAVEGEDPPDLYLLSRRDLDPIVAQGRNVPLLELLDERGVAYGDNYSRDGLLAFSADSDLQCMPYTVSPTVVYYNTDLVDFDQMARRGLPLPSETLRSWSFEAFAAAAQFATRPQRHTRGAYVAPTLRGLAPFVYSGAGNLFDDAQSPTSLNLEDGGARDALTQALALLRNPLVTLNDAQLERRTPLQWFEAGKLGMITGTRELVPRLRQVDGLGFDVMPMPSVGSQATVGDVSGVCISSSTDETARAADFLVSLIGDAAVAQVAISGYIVPANLGVALSPQFLQPSQMPLNANIFNTTVRGLVVSPLIDEGGALDQAVAPQITALFADPQIDDLELRLQQIDQTSREVLDPTYTPPVSPSASSSGP